MKIKKSFIGITLSFLTLGLSSCSHYYDKRCNLFSSDESIVCTAVLIGALPVALAKYPTEKRKEESRKHNFLLNRKAGVLNGERIDLENCVQFCHLSTQDSAEQVALSKLASEKLIRLDDPNVEMTTNQLKAMVKAYSNLQYELDFSNVIKKQYAGRAWDLIKKITEKNEYYEIDESSVNVIGSIIYLYHDRLINKNIQQATLIFDQCMTDRFWVNANFEPSSLQVMQFCKVALNWYVSENSHSIKQDEASYLKISMSSKWQEEWDLALKKKYSKKG